VAKQHDDFLIPFLTGWLVGLVGSIAGCYIIRFLALLIAG